MEAHNGRSLLAGGEEGIPLAAEDGGQPQLGGELRETHRFEAAGRVGPDLGRGDLHVGQPGKLQGDDPVRVRAGPHLEVPIVEGAHAGEPEILVRRPRVHRTAETRDERREAQRGPDAGAVHVQNAGVDVEAAGPHFVEAGRLHAPLRPRSADDRVEPDVGIQVPLEDPALGPVFLLDDAGRRRGEGGGQPVLEEIRGLDQVVVDRDHGHQDRPGLRVGEQGGPARCGPCVDGSHGKVTLSSVKLSGSGVRMTTYVDDVSTRVGLLIDGALVAGGEGTYPVTNPARPAEVVLDAPSTSPAQLDLAVGAARRSQRAWAALEPAAARGHRRGRGRSGRRGRGAPRPGPPPDPGARQDAPGGDLRHHHHGGHGGGLRTPGGRGARGA